MPWNQRAALVRSSFCWRNPERSLDCKDFNFKIKHLCTGEEIVWSASSIKFHVKQPLFNCECQGREQLCKLPLKSPTKTGRKKQVTPTTSRAPPCYRQKPQWCTSLEIRYLFTLTEEQSSSNYSTQVFSCSSFSSLACWVFKHYVKVLRSMLKV